MSEDVDARIDALIGGPLYAWAQTDKDAELLSILKPLCACIAGGCPEWARFVDRSGPPIESWTHIDQIPPLPVSMFKRFELLAVARDQIQRELHSSSTTGDRPSRIFVDRRTASLQTRALAAVLKERIGAQRRPFLVLDIPEVADAGDVLGARGAAIRGLSSFARETTFALKRAEGGGLDLDLAALERFFARHGGQPMLIFGFTFMVWVNVFSRLRTLGLSFDGSRATLLHSGGWKKLQERAVDKATFATAANELLGIATSEVVDFYGMVEQVGSVFLDCQAGNKHAPAFADVVIRRPGSLEPCAIGDLGLIEVLSVLPHSYPGQALLTEDQGAVIGIDDCSCGRRGRYFRFNKRVERVAIRGCGDTFGQMQGAG